MFDLPSECIEDIETFKQILRLTGDNMPRSSASVCALNEVAGKQKPRGAQLCSYSVLN